MRQLLRNLRTMLAGLAVGIALALIGLFVMPYVAGAAVPPGVDVPVGPDTEVDSLFKLTPFWVQIIGGALIPFVVAFVTNQNIAAWFKRTLLAALAALVGLITTATVDDAGNSIFTQSALESAFFAFLSAAGVYTIFVRNSRTEAKLNAVGPDIGPTKTDEPA